jgi:hypothetical protein
MHCDHSDGVLNIKAADVAIQNAACRRKNGLLWKTMLEQYAVKSIEDNCTPEDGVFDQDLGLS